MLPRVLTQSHAAPDVNPQLAMSQALQSFACGFTPVSLNPLGRRIHMSNDWKAFAEDCNWYVRKRRISVGDCRPFEHVLQITQECRTNFPEFSNLLSRARATEVILDDIPHVLLGWDALKSGSTGWLSPIPSANTTVSLFPQHQELLRSFGGILERWNEPEDTWLLNLNEALTEEGS